MKKIKPIYWILIAIAVYYFFIKETTTIETEDGVNPDADPNSREKCGGRKCKAVRRKGIFGIGRQVAKDYCTSIQGTCKCLGEPCGR